MAQVGLFFSHKTSYDVRDFTEREVLKGLREIYNSLGTMSNVTSSELTKKAWKDVEECIGTIEEVIYKPKIASPDSP